MSDLSQDQLDELNFLTNYGQVPVARGADGSYVPVGRDIQGRGQAPAGAIAGRRSSTPSYRPDHQIGIFNFDVDTRGANNDWTAVAPTGNPIGRTTTGSPGPAPTDFMSWLSGQFYNPNAGDQNLNEHANLIARGVPGANQGSRLARMGAPALPGLGTVADWTEVNTVGHLGINIAANALTLGAGAVIGKAVTKAADSALMRTVARGLEKRGMAELAGMVRRGQVGVTKSELKAAQESIDRIKANPGARSLNTVGYEQGRTVGRALSQSDLDAIDLVRRNAPGTKVDELDFLASKGQGAKEGAAATRAITAPQEASWTFDPVKYNMVRGDNEQAQKRSIELAFQREADGFARAQATRIHPENSPNWVNTYRQAYNHFYQTRAPQFLEGQAAMDVLTNRGMQAGKEAVPRGLILPGERAQIVLNPSRADFRTLSHETGHAVDLGLDRVDYTDPASIAAAENRADSWADQVARRDRRFDGNAPQPLPQGPSPITNAGAFEQDVSDPRQRLIRNFVYDGLSGRANLSEAIGRRTNVIHETSPKSAASLATRALSVNGGQRFWVSDAPDLALGQGGKGVRLHFDSDMVNGFKPKNLANGVLQDGGEYVVDKSATDALRTLEFKSEKQMQAFRRIQGMEGRFDFNAPRKTEYGWAVDRKRAPLFEGDDYAKLDNKDRLDASNNSTTAAARSIPEPGGVRGVSGLLEGQVRQSMGSQAAREPDGSLLGLPRKVGNYAPSVDPRATQVAEQYMGSRGLPYNPPNTYAKVDPARASRIATAFEEMAHDPKNPQVKASYDAMILETLDQYEAMLKTGIEIEFAYGGDPYNGNPRNMIEDVRQNNHMWVFPTEEGYGADDVLIGDNPLLVRTPFLFKGQPTVANDIFRAVHDYFGHVKEGVGFRADGEENAWRAHSAMYSDLARGAMTSETRGQNSWVNFGPYGEANRVAQQEATRYADQKAGLLPQWAIDEGRGDAMPGGALFEPDGLDAAYTRHLNDYTVAASYHMRNGASPNAVIARLTQDYPQNAAFIKANVRRILGGARSLLEKFPAAGPTFGDEVSARVVTGKEPLVDPLGFHISNLDDVRLDPKYEEKLFEKMKASDPRLAKAKNLNQVVEMLGENLIHLWKHANPVVREIGKLWYDGGNAIANRWADRYGKTAAQMSGMLAVFSPQTDWFVNVSRAERTADILTYHAHKPWDEAMTKVAKHMVTQDPDTKAFKRLISDQEIAQMAGRSLNDLEDSGLQARWLRTYDQTYNPRGYRSVTPDGRFGEYMTTNKNQLRQMAWGDFNMIEKAIAIFNDNSVLNISDNLGEEHKVRNFYNNIVSPNSPRGHYTSDTHNAAASHIRPFSSKSPQVGAMLGGAPSNINTGHSGTYPVYQQAGQLAAKEVGVLPRELQSVTWETVRSLFTNKDDRLKATVDAIILKNAKGRISRAEAWKQILEASGGIDNPTWLSDFKTASAERSSYLEGDVSGSGRIRPQSGMDRRVGNDYSGPASGLEQGQNGGLDPLYANAITKRTKSTGRIVAKAERLVAKEARDTARAEAAAAKEATKANILFEPDEPTLQGWVVAGEAAIKSGKKGYGAWAGAMKKAGLTAAEIKQYGKPLFELVNRNVQEGVPRSVSDRLATGQDVNPRGLGFGQAAKRLLYDDRTYLDEATRMLERVNEQPSGALEGSPIDINAAWRKAARAGNLAGAYVENGILGDASTGYAPLTKGLPEIQSMLDQAGIPAEEWQRYRRAMRQIELDMRAGGGQGYDSLYDKYRPLNSDPQAADQVHQAEVAGFLSKYGQKVQPIDDAFDQYTNEQLMLLERYGLKPSGYAGDMRLSNQNYFPLHAADTYTSKAMGDITGGDSRVGLDSDLIPAVGNRQPQDGFASMAQQTESWVRKGERNQALLPFLDEASNSSMLDWMVREVTDDPSALEANGIRRSVGEANIKGKDLEFDPEEKSGIITIYDQGKPRHFQVDPRLYSALAGSKQSTNNFTQFMTWLASLQRNLTTQRNPLFSWFFNPMIDVSAAVINHGMNPLQFFKGYATTFRGMNDPIYRAWVANLGQSSGLSARDYVEDRLKYAGMKRLPNGMPHRVLKWADDWILRGGPIEEATRVGFFRQVRHSLIKQGMPVEEAERIAAARSVELMDFGRASTLGRAMTRYGAVYGNIPAQSMRSLAVGFKKNPTAFVARASMLLVAPKILEYQTYKDDPDYMDQPDGWKDMGFHFKAGDQWITIPVDQLHQSLILGNTRRALQWSDGQGPGPEKTAADLAMAVGYPMVKPAAMTPLSNILINTFQKHNNEAMMDLTFGRSVGGKLGDDPTPEQIAKRDAAYWQLMAQSNFGTLGKLGAQAYFHQQGLAKAPNPLARFTIDMARGNSPTPDPTGIDRILEGTMPGDPNTDIDRILRETLGPQY
jgi:hypothetical protein